MATSQTYLGLSGKITRNQSQCPLPLPGKGQARQVQHWGSVNPTEVTVCAPEATSFFGLYPCSILLLAALAPESLSPINHFLRNPHYRLCFEECNLRHCISTTHNGVFWILQYTVEYLNLAPNTPLNSSHLSPPPPLPAIAVPRTSCHQTLTSAASSGLRLWH